MLGYVHPLYTGNCSKEVVEDLEFYASWPNHKDQCPVVMVDGTFVDETHHYWDEHSRNYAYVLYDYTKLRAPHSALANAEQCLTILSLR